MHPSNVVGRCADGRKRHPQIDHARKLVEEVVRQPCKALAAMEGGCLGKIVCRAPLEAQAVADACKCFGAADQCGWIGVLPGR